MASTATISEAKAFVSSTVDRLMSKDRDFRYMALSDLLAELQKPDFKIDVDLQKRICVLMLQVLQDSSTEVQGLAMKCLPHLVAKVTTQQAVELVHKLTVYLTDTQNNNDTSTTENYSFGPKDIRDVAAMALRSIVLQLPASSPHSREMAFHLMPVLTTALSKHPDVQLEALELVFELLARQGHYLSRFHEKLSTELLLLISKSHPQSRKRVVQCIAMLASLCTTQLFDAILGHLKNLIQPKGDTSLRRTAVQTINAIGKSNAQRLVPHLNDFLPVLMAYAADQDSTEDIDLREQCLQVFEVVISKCGAHATPFLPDMITVLTASIKYDPNYAPSSDDEGAAEDQDDLMQPSAMESDMGMPEPEQNSDDEESQYSDDDDASWKIRRSSVRLASAMITTKLFPQEECYRKVGLVLISRLAEREEAVRLDIFAATGELFQYLSRASSPTCSGNAMVDDVTPASRQADFGVDLSYRGASIVRVIKNELGTTSVRGKAGALGLLKSLVKYAPDIVVGRIWAVAPEIEKCLGEANTNVKTEALSLLRTCVPTATHPSMAPVVVRLMPIILATTMDRYYKVTSDALSLCGTIVEKFGSHQEIRASLIGVVMDIYTSAHKRLSAPDQDSEVKESGITCVGAVIAFYGDVLEPQLAEASTLFMDRMRNEVTRVAAVRAVGTVGQSYFSNSLEPHYENITEILASFLRKHDRTLRQATLETLVVTSTLIPEHQIGILLRELTSQIRDDDMKIAALSIRLCSDLIQVRGSTILDLLATSVYPTILEFISSPLLQGQALDAVLNFLRSLAVNGAPPLTGDRAVQDVLRTGIAKRDKLTKTGNRTVAQCVAALCETTTVDRSSVICNLMSDACAASNEDHRNVFALTCLGELGRKSLLGDKFEDVRGAIVLCLDSSSEDVKSQSALALGCISAGNGSSGVPSLANLVLAKEDVRYLHLVALREAIIVSSIDDLNKHVKLILRVLVEVASSWGGAPSAQNGNGTASNTNTITAAGEESIRTATAECLGLICAANPEVVMPALEMACGSSHPGLRATAAIAVKVAISSKESESSLEAALSPVLQTVLKLVEDDDIVVRRGVLGCIGALARSRPIVLRSRVGDLVPRVIEQTVKREDLVRVVDLGPFKYYEDDGLETRKVAFECMNSILVCYGDIIELGGLVEALVPGLTDHHDVKTIAHLTLINVANNTHVREIVPSLDQVVAALKTTLTLKLKASAVRQELEEHEDAVRGALRVVRALDGIPVISSQDSFAALMNSVVHSERLREKYEGLAGDGTGSTATRGGIGGLGGIGSSLDMEL